LSAEPDVIGASTELIGYVDEWIGRW